ncbi:MAG: DUF3099 domain-containing protein [Corynebacterium sp.]|nr:DUF3099 domain-containing protein [Corynebacterium sp.]
MNDSAQTGSATHAHSHAEPPIDIPANDVAAQQPGMWQRWWRALRGKRPELVTDAQRSPTQNREHRIKVYTWMQAVRVPFLLLSGWTYLELRNWVLSGILFIISVPISWISVVIGNGHGEKRDSRRQQVYKPAQFRYQQYASDLSGRPNTTLEAGRTESSQAIALRYPNDATAADTAQPDGFSTTPPTAQARTGDNPPRATGFSHCAPLNDDPDESRQAETATGAEKDSGDEAPHWPVSFPDAKTQGTGTGKRQK